MSLLAGQVVVSALASTQLNSEERDFFQAQPVAGFTLFRWNLPNPQELVVQLNRELQQLRPVDDPPLVIAIDQEGGRVARLKSPFPDHGPAQKLAGGKSDVAALAAIKDYGTEVARALFALGFNVDFAPVLDVLTEPTNTAIGDRVFGTDPSSVIKRAGAFLDGLQQTGMIGCLKHFPGQGDAKVDTHLGSAIINHTQDFLRQREIAPFKALIPRVGMVMLSHCIYPAWDDRPASLSKAVINSLLKQELGFSGLVVSDDMMMEAIAQDTAKWQENIVSCVAAGVDMVLVCKKLERTKMAIDALDRAANDSSVFADRLQDAAARVRQFRKSLVPVLG